PANIQSIGAASVFRDAALFHGHLFVAGPHGLVEYGPNGELIRRLRPGLELPPVRIVSPAVGVLTTASAPELLMATDGDGLLIFDGRRLRQVRPERAEHRKLTAT